MKSMIELSMNNKINDSNAPFKFYAVLNPIKNDNKFLPKKKTVKIQKIDDYAYLTRQLFHAVQHGYLNFLESVPQKNWQNRLNVLDDKNGYSLLHYACLKNQKDIVSFLLLFKPDVNIIGAKQTRPIHLAVQQGHDEIVELLCRQKSIQIDAADVKGQTPLHTACRRGHTKAVNILLKYGASVHKLELDKISIIHHPVRRNDIEMIKILIAYEAPLNIKNNNGQTPSMIAAIEGHFELFDYLMKEMKKQGEYLPNILNEIDNDGLSCLSHAVHNKNAEIIKLCIENGVDLNERQTDGKTILHTAAIIGYVDLFNIIGENSCNINATDYGLNTPLHHAVMNNNIAMVTILIEKGANLNVCNRNFQTPIMLACIEIAQSKNSAEIIQILNESNADLKIKDFEMKTIFHYLVEKENIDMIKYFTKNLRPDILSELINSQDDSHNSPLHCAAKNGNSQICKLFVEIGANTLLFSENESLALHVATIHGHLECVKILLEASKETTYYRDGDENSAINLAAEHGRYEIYKHLVEIGKDKNSKDEFGRNTLMYAAKSGCLPIVMDLLNDEVNVNLCDQIKTTALHQAAENGHLEIVNVLWKHGAKLSEDIFGNSQLDVAIINNQFHIVRFFLSNENWKRVMKFRHKNGHSHIKILIKHDEEIALELLDKCITENISNRMDPNYEVKYWFGILDSGPDDTASINKRFLALNSMSKHGRLELLKHPLSVKLLEFKWKKFGLGFYLIDFIVYLLFLICINVYMSIYSPVADTDSYTSTTGCKTTNSSVTVDKSSAPDGIFFMNILIYSIISSQLILLIIKLLSQRQRFFMEVWNYIFITNDILVFLFIKNPKELPCLYEWQFAPGLIFLAWFLLLYYLKFFPLIGIKVMMFQKVLISIIKAFAIFFCLFVGFGFGFYIINNTQDPFKTQGLGIIKSIGMMIGELEIVSYFVTGKKNYSNVSYAMIICFMIIMPITFFNLMIGLAIGDISNINEEAELEIIRLKVNFVWEVESQLPIKIQRYLYKSEIIENSRNLKNIKILNKILDKTDFKEQKLLRKQETIAYEKEFEKMDEKYRITQ